MHYPIYPILDVSQTLKVRPALAIGPETSTASAKLERTAERASCPLSHATVPDLRGKLGYDIREHSHVFGFQTASVAEQPCRIRNRSRSPTRLLRSRAPADGTPSVGLEVLGRAPRLSADLGEQRRHIPGRFPVPRSGRRHDHAQLSYRDYWSSNIYAQSRFGDLQSKNRYGWLGKGVEHSDYCAALSGAATAGIRSGLKFAVPAPSRARNLISRLFVFWGSCVGILLRRLLFGKTIPTPRPHRTG